jgi:hypothetical protein
VDRGWLKGTNEGKYYFVIISSERNIFHEQVFLPAIKGLVPPMMVEAIHDLLDFSYLVCWNSLDEKTLDMANDALAHFHQHHEIFHTTGIRPTGFPLPRKHSLVYYLINIQDFGALCSSITECCHKSAVKQPWCRSSPYEALGQMLLTNQWLDKLAASQAEFIDCGMLPPDQPPPPHQNEGEAEDEESGPVEGEQVMAHVTLGRTWRMWFVKLNLLLKS